MPAPKDPEKRKEWRRKMSEARMGKEPANKGKKGYKHTPEARAKISAANIGHEGYWKGRTSPQKGARWTPEQRLLQSQRQKGKPRSPEATRKAAESNRGKKLSPEHVEIIRRNSIGRKASPEARANMAASQRAYWQSRPEDERRAHLDKLHAATKDITESWIENYYAQQLDMQGIIYERQKRIGWYRVDFYVPATNTVIEVNGCYWHCCEVCGYTNKHKGKQEADEKRYAYLRGKGYTVAVIWEHDLPKKPRIS